MSDSIHAAIVGFDITPEIHPEYGAWGTTPVLTEIHMPLLGRCVALRQGDQHLIWYGIDHCGLSVPETLAIRTEIAASLGVDTEEIVWSTSQTHSSPTFPGSRIPGGSSITVRGAYDEAYCAAERVKIMKRCIDAGRAALEQAQPIQLLAGRGFCDSMSYNTRFPMPDGGVKFSRHHLEALKSGKFYDPEIGLLVFTDRGGKALGAIFNFCSHPATMINDKYISPDWVGTARACIEDALDGAPAMFVQGFCGDVNCRHIFGTPEQASASGKRLGDAAVRALPTLNPVRADRLILTYETIRLHCRPMWTVDEVNAEIGERRAYIESLKTDPEAAWVAGINLPEAFNPEEKAATVQVQLQYFDEALRILAAGEPVRTGMEFRLGAARIGDVGVLLSHGENFTAAGLKVRQRSPFAHTLVCGDTNGMFGYLGDDAEMDRGGYETQTYWQMLYIDGFRLAPRKGTADRIIDTSVDLLWRLQKDN